jgi:hypothetical protein
MNNRITINNIHEYKQEIVNDNQILLTRINRYLTEEELFQNDLRKSRIIRCRVNNYSIRKIDFNTILYH